MSEKSQTELNIYKIITTRDPQFTNFVEFQNYKVIYRRYAGLFFALAVDVNDNELAYLETLHLFVELLDSYFANVCELDLVFNFNKVYQILDEYVMAGEVQETSKANIITQIHELENLP